MPYPAGHREQVRRRIVDSARRLFNRSGFEGVSVDCIMAHAGLTRGGFYSYFESKSDLYAEVLSCFFTDPNWKSRWEGIEVDLASAGAGPEIVRAYLSRQHFEDVENSCPMIALPSDVARGGEQVKSAFETVFKAMVSVLDRDVRNRKMPREDTAMAIAALCVGGMVVARSMNDRRLADRLREAASGVALELGGWTRNRPVTAKAKKMAPKTRAAKAVAGTARAH
ncbi:MAG: TetR/AcrR family transcriptional regulator [Bryobacteraceae bacterium]|jgi:AcrR family transcriptional regulator